MGNQWKNFDATSLCHKSLQQHEKMKIKRKKLKWKKSKSEKACKKVPALATSSALQKVVKSTTNASREEKKLHKHSLQKLLPEKAIMSCSERRFSWQKPWEIPVKEFSFNTFPD